MTASFICQPKERGIHATLRTNLRGVIVGWLWQTMCPWLIAMNFPHCPAVASFVARERAGVAHCTIMSPFFAQRANITLPLHVNRVPLVRWAVVVGHDGADAHVQPNHGLTENG